MSSLADIVPPGVVTGDNLVKLLDHARSNGYAIRKYCAHAVLPYSATTHLENVCSPPMPFIFNLVAARVRVPKEFAQKP